MPEVNPKNTLWHRGGKLNEKHHFELTDAEKEHVATCKGNRASHPCKNPIFRCKECGNYGCVQEVADKCPAQGFKGDKCLNCGKVDSRVPVMEDELAKFIEEWEKNDQ